VHPHGSVAIAIAAALLRRRCGRHRAGDEQDQTDTQAAVDSDQHRGLLIARRDSGSARRAESRAWHRGNASRNGRATVARCARRPAQGRPLPGSRNTRHLVGKPLDCARGPAQGCRYLSAMCHELTNIDAILVAAGPVPA
jgi:hypothetical protein